MPADKVVLKRLVVHASSTAQGFNPCAISLVVCRVNESGPPASVEHIEDRDRPVRLGSIQSAYEAEDVDHSSSWIGYLLAPGHQRIEIADRSCGEKSLLRSVGMGVLATPPIVAGPPYVAALVVAVGALAGAASHGSHKPPVVLEFDADPGRSYLLECDPEREPWVWVTPDGPP